MSGMHFERMAAEYAGARPPYPGVVFDTLETAGVIGDGRRVLEIGAGAGLATEELVRRGSEVTALEPGPRLAALIRDAVPAVREVLPVRLEDAHLDAGVFDSVVAATSLHWVDLSVGLPVIHGALRPHGWLAVWRTVFGDDDVRTPFRDRVHEIVSRRDQRDEPAGELRPTVDELAAGGWFEPVRTEHWRWSIDLSARQVGRLFATFSTWTPAEAAAAEQAADDLGGRVTEHYRSLLHLLRRTPRG
ncbi:MAG: class I SAM-dependent methyltransferase [Nocardioidaceae bacterium]|nr:class I SAM-dependent methyltransferase [Nocardioidaceae bacterium]